MESRIQSRCDDRVWTTMLTVVVMVVIQFGISVTLFKGYYIFGFFLGAVPVICWDCFIIPTVRMCNEKMKDLTVGKYFSENWNNAVREQPFNAPVFLKYVIAFLFLLLINSIRGMRYLIIPVVVTIFAKILQTALV